MNCEEYVKSTGEKCSYKYKIIRDDGKKVCGRHIKNKTKVESEIKVEQKVENEAEPEPKVKLNIPKPIIKWVGGKSQIIQELLPRFPSEINNYYEIFIGGGSVLLSLLSYIKEGLIKVYGNIKAYDLNECLVYVYKNIQSHHFELYDALKNIIEEYNNCSVSGTINRKPASLEEGKTSKESYYYWIRNRFNKNKDKKSILSSALFIFLNKTCFRGLYREGSNGFNVPYGHYNNPEIINREHLEEIHTLIQPVIFQCADFKTSIFDIQQVSDSNDFMYLDPPYAPENSTSFVSYNKAGFTIQDNIDLFELIKSLNFRFMMSNADVTFVRENFTTDYHIKSILCRRAINSKNPASKSNEVIISNY